MLNAAPRKLIESTLQIDQVIKRSEKAKLVYDFSMFALLQKYENSKLPNLTSIKLIDTELS